MDSQLVILVTAIQRKLFMRETHCHVALHCTEVHWSLSRLSIRHVLECYYKLVMEPELETVNN